ncbi:MAG TPA: hypothetical protein VJJ76_00410 [archaeon]|nr:hypothetical protein [archaeon]
MDWKKLKKIDRKFLILAAFAIFAGIFDGLFGIDQVRNQIFSIDYQSFWGAYLSVYFFVAVILLFGIKNKLRLFQATLIAFALWGLGRFVHIFDALRLGFVDQTHLMQMRYEFTNVLGSPITFSFSEIIALNLLFILFAVLIEVYKRKRHQ